MCYELNSSTKKMCFQLPNEENISPYTLEFIPAMTTWGQLKKKTKQEKTKHTPDLYM